LLLWLCSRFTQRQCPLRHTSARCDAVHLVCTVWPPCAHRGAPSRGGACAHTVAAATPHLSLLVQRIDVPHGTQAPEELKNLGMFRIMFEKWPDCTALQETAINAGMPRVSAKVAALALQHTPAESSQQKASFGSGPGLWSGPRSMLQRGKLRISSTYALKRSSSSSIPSRKSSMKSLRRSSSDESPKRPSIAAVPDGKV
jgi:hypothetical protein